MIARLHAKPLAIVPVHDAAMLSTESDVEQRFLYPFLAHPEYLALPHEWIRTKDYMLPTEIDKTSGKRYGYLPDYSIWTRGIPVLIVEAKGPDVVVELGYREARLYAGELNKRYPAGINPIQYLLASNGLELILGHADSEQDFLKFNIADLLPGSQALATLRSFLNKMAFEKRAIEIANQLAYRRFHPIAPIMGGQQALGAQIGVNEFAQALFPTLSKFFAADITDTPDEVIDRAYVSSDEVGNYEGILQTYLKDRTKKVAGNTVQAIDTSKSSASGISSEISKFSSNPNFFSRVQLVIGAVGAGKSTFSRRFYRKLMPTELRAKTRWAFLNFNSRPPEGMSLLDWICDQFIESFIQYNGDDIFADAAQEKIFSVQLRRFENGPAKRLKSADHAAYERERYELLKGLTSNYHDFVQAIARHYGGERSLGIVVVFDNVDKRSRDEQLEIFSAAQWFRDLTKSLVLVNLRDTTFEAHKNEPPLDAFSNAINFYIRPPRFSQVIRKRLDLVLENISEEIDQIQSYELENGVRIRYPASRLGEFLLGIYLAMFARRDRQITHVLEGIVAKDIRRALGMFGDIIVSPHVPTHELTGAALTSGRSELKEFVLLKSLMRGRYRYFNGTSKYIRNILHTSDKFVRPSNFLMPDILEFLARNRKERVDFAQEGYVLVSTLISRMSQLGYDEADTALGVAMLVDWGLVEPESLLTRDIAVDDAVRIHASGYVHLRFLLSRSEYVVGITPDLSVSSFETAERIANIWSSRSHLNDISLSNKKDIAQLLARYFSLEYAQRCGRHAFYDELGFGGRAVVAALDSIARFADVDRGRSRLI